MVGGYGTAGRTFAWSRDGQSLLFLAGDRGAISLYRAGLANGSASKVLGGERVIDEVAATYDGFFFGRFDLRVGSVEALARGDGFKVIELNGVTSEATHI